MHGGVAVAVAGAGWRLAGGRWPVAVPVVVARGWWRVGGGAWPLWWILTVASAGETCVGYVGVTVVIEFSE